MTGTKVSIAIHAGEKVGSRTRNDGEKVSITIHDGKKVSIPIHDGK